MDSHRRELARLRAAGDEEAAGKLRRRIQQSCEHKWDRLAIFAPGFTDTASAHPRLGQVAVYICWECLSLRLKEGTRLCYYCHKPGRLKKAVIYRDPEHLDYVHEECLVEFSRAKRTTGMTLEERHTELEGSQGARTEDGNPQKDSDYLQ